MKKEYSAPEFAVAELNLLDAVLASAPAPGVLPTESGNEMPILTKKIVRDELNGDPHLDPEDLLEAPTEF